MRGTSTIAALLFGVVVAAFVVGTSGCSTAVFLYELLKDDDKASTPTATAEDAAVAATIVTTDAAVEVVDAATGPCAVARPCEGGVCSLGGTCEPERSDGDACVASWECAGGHCAWNASAGSGVCASTLSACRTTQTGCSTSEAHSCCEGSRCNPAQFGALPQCATCNVTGIACDELTADSCCSGTCSFGHCQ